MRLRETVQGEFKSDKIVHVEKRRDRQLYEPRRANHQPRELVLDVPSDLCL
jgi:hypothetical protein